MLLIINPINLCTLRLYHVSYTESTLHCTVAAILKRVNCAIAGFPGSVPVIALVLLLGTSEIFLFFLWKIICWKPCFFTGLEQLDPFNHSLVLFFQKHFYLSLRSLILVFFISVFIVILTMKVIIFLLKVCLRASIWVIKIQQLFIIFF